MKDLAPIGPQAIIEKKQRYLIPCVYHFYKNPPQIVKGEGTHLIDSEGKRYLDLYAGVAVHALGHCHPELTEAICRQVRTLTHTSTIYLTEPIVNLAEALAAVLPGDLDKTFFCASGSEAVEGAALLATMHTGRAEFLAFQNALHGRTKFGMSLTGLAFWRTDPHPVGGITHVPPPDCANCPFGKTKATCNWECIQAVETAIQTSTSGRPAAMIVEPVQGNGGILVPPAEYFTRLRAVLDKYGMLLICDETQTGFGRTGRMFAIKHWGVAPDIIAGGKALGGGLPMGYFSTRAAIAASYTRPGASTFGGNPVCAAAGLAFLNILRRDELVQRSAELGAQLKQRLEDLARRQPLIHEVRGLGLMIGIELTGQGDEPPSVVTDHVLERMKDAGFLLGKTGALRNVLTMMPPLIIEPPDLDNAVVALEAALQDIALL
jgi:4-aminobutyrate aminotransferase/4-aminobutyrate aminotransferase/(S)-3-amino-2-methylpropionate transaminase